MILFKQNSFDASLKPHYNHDGAKWTLIDMVCSQLVQGGGGARLLAQSATWLHIFIFILFSFSSLHSILPHCPHHPHLPYRHTHTHTHCYFRNAGHYRSQPLRPIRVWQPHLTRQAVPQLRRSNKHIRALRADGLYRHEVKNRAGEAWDNDIAGWENWMKRNKECDRGNGITFWAHHAIFCLMGYLPEECKDNL